MMGEADTCLKPMQLLYDFEENGRKELAVDFFIIALYNRCMLLYAKKVKQSDMRDTIGWIKEVEGLL